MNNNEIKPLTLSTVSGEHVPDLHTNGKRNDRLSRGPRLDDDIGAFRQTDFFRSPNYFRTLSVFFPRTLIHSDSDFGHRSTAPVGFISESRVYFWPFNAHNVIFPNRTAGNSICQSPSLGRSNAIVSEPPPPRISLARGDRSRTSTRSCVTRYRGRSGRIVFFAAVTAVDDERTRFDHGYALRVFANNPKHGFRFEPFCFSTHCKYVTIFDNAVVHWPTVYRVKFF